MIRLQHVSKDYPTAGKPALDDVSVEVGKGEFVFLVGSSGSGKSTFLKLLLKEERPTRGQVHVAGKDLGTMSAWKVPALRRSIGCVFQDFRLLPDKDVAQNVAYALEVIGKPRHQVAKIVPEVLDLVGLKDKGRRMPHELSGGEQQRVAIARAFANRPMIVLADEPTGNLDPTTSVGIMRLLDRINRTGTTVVMATHDAQVVDSMRRRVVELDGGQVVRDQDRGVYGFGSEPVRVQRTISEAGLGLRRNLVMSTAAVLTIAVSLAFAGGALLVRQTVDRLQDAFFTEIEVAVYLNADVTDAQRTDVQQTLEALPLVERVSYASKQDAYQRFLKQNPNEPDLTNNVTADTLPESFNVKLTDPEQFDIVSSAAQDLPGVDEVDDNRDVLQPLFQVLTGLKFFAYAIAVIQVIAAGLLIANTVRLTVFSRRREIGVMRLVGATRWYIQLPFLIEGVIVGVLGTAVAGGLLGAGKRFLIDGRLDGLFTGVVQRPSWHDIFISQGPWLLAFGLLVSAAASFATLWRYVRV